MACKHGNSREIYLAGTNRMLTILWWILQCLCASIKSEIKNKNENEPAWIVNLITNHTQ